MANTKITNPELFNLGDSTSATQLPVMTTTERIAMTGLSVGEMIFNSTTDKVEYFDGTKWYGITYFVPYSGIVVGASGSNTLIFSADGINWTGLGNSIFSIYGNKSAYNGSMWVAAGRGTNSLAYSTDGINWTGLGAIFNVWGNSVSWNGSYWLACGYGSNAPGIYKSTDGISWTAAGGNGTIHKAAWSGSTWVVAQSNGGGVVGSGNHTIATSTNGTTWTGQGQVFANDGNDVAWNGSMWVAVGYSGSGGTSIAYTTNSAGTSGWTAVISSPLTDRGLGVAWNGSIWVACGYGSNNIATSTDGINWTGRGTPGEELLYDVSWNGEIFIAVGGSNDYVVTSTDGIIWSAPTTNPSNIYGLGVGTAPAPNLYPPI